MHTSCSKIDLSQGMTFHNYMVLKTDLSARYSWGPNKRTGTAIYLLPIFHLVRAYLVPVRLLIFKLLLKNIQNLIFDEFLANKGIFFLAGTFISCRYVY